jgi:hypothetical protein
MTLKGPGAWISKCPASPDIKSEYINKTTKKSSWIPKEGRNRWYKPIHPGSYK